MGKVLSMPHAGENRSTAETRLSGFMGCVETINGLGERAGYHNLAFEFAAQLLALTVSASAPTLSALTGITPNKKWYRHRTNKSHIAGISFSVSEGSAIFPCESFPNNCCLSGIVEIGLMSVYTELNKAIA